jgi:hypothetical protein
LGIMNVVLIRIFIAFFIGMINRYYNQENICYKILLVIVSL